MTNKLIQLLILLLLLCGSLNAQDTETKKAKSEKSRYTLALMPAITIPYEGLGEYSVGYGFNMNALYKLTEDISLSGNIEVVFSDFKYLTIFPEGCNYNVTSHWYSFDIGPKVFLNRGTTRIYLSSNFKYTLIFNGEGDKCTGELLNPEQAIGFSFGFGFEIPVNDKFKIEVSPVCNILYPLNNINTLSSHTENAYYKISLGLNYNL